MGNNAGPKPPVCTRPALHQRSVLFICRLFWIKLFFNSLLLGAWSNGLMLICQFAGPMYLTGNGVPYNTACYYGILSVCTDYNSSTRWRSDGSTDSRVHLITSPAWNWHPNAHHILACGVRKLLHVLIKKPIKTALLMQRKKILPGRLWDKDITVYAD